MWGCVSRPIRGIWNLVCIACDWWPAPKYRVATWANLLFSTCSAIGSLLLILQFIQNPNFAKPMKNLCLLLLTLLLMVSFTACASDKKTDEAEEADEEVNDNSDNEYKTGVTMSTWEGHSAKDSPGGDGKWVASIAFGEELTLLNETETDAKTNKSYEKVRLLDGKEGWVRADFVAIDASLEAVVQDAQIYKRPGISNISDDMVLTGTVVIVKGHKDDFAEFIARNDANNKRKEGWLLGDKALTSDETDVSAALLYSKAMNEKVPTKRQDKLKQVVTNYPNSVFAKTAQNALDAAAASEDLSEDQLMITGDNVNVRSGPTVKEENKVFQLASGDICSILERGEMDEIGGKLDYWYKINYKGQSGWIFGTFTSKAQ
jgi:uncharacterized protein YgiM (DUF1202 family)